jgi:DNA invertase Pin-like site-specific DNA recombinase
MKSYGYVSSSIMEEQLELLSQRSSFLILRNEELSEKEAFLSFLKKYSEENILIYSLSSLGFGITLIELTEIIDYIIEHQISIEVIDKGVAKDLSTKNYLLIFLDIQEMESEAKSFRTSQGLLQAQQAGTILGRPAVSEELIEKVKFLHEKKLTYREIATKTNLSLGSVYKYVRYAGGKGEDTI